MDAQTTHGLESPFGPEGAFQPDLLTPPVTNNPEACVCAIEGGATPACSDIIIFPVGNLAILKARVNFQVNGESRSGIVALDTCSNHNIVALPYGRASGHVRTTPMVVEVCGGETKLGPSAVFNLVRSNGETVGPFHGSLGHNGRNGLLPTRCVALFGRAILRKLNVDLNWHQDYEGPKIPLLHVRPTNASGRPQILVSERAVREYLQRQADEQDAPGDPTTAPVEPWQTVDVNPDTSPEFQRKVWNLLETNKHVFLDSKTLPPVMKGEPHKFILKPDAKIVACPEPRWTPAKAEYVDGWAEDGLRSGLMELAPNSPYASRVHIADKAGGELRPTGDYVRLNDQIVKVAPQVPHLLGQVMGFQRCAIFFESDAPKAFYMVDLHEDSRNLTTVWTRKLGKVRFTRLNFGHKNASTVLQTRMSRALQPLPAPSREAVKNYADDFVGGAEGEEELFCVLRDFLTLAIVPNNISLKASKTRIGYPNATYGGYVLGSG